MNFNIDIKILKSELAQIISTLESNKCFSKQKFESRIICVPAKASMNSWDFNKLENARKKEPEPKCYMENILVLCTKDLAKIEKSQNLC